MPWIYNLAGKPGVTPGCMIPVTRQEEPGDALVIERQDDPGVCDGYLLRSQDTGAHTAAYDWIGCGTPELVIPMITKSATERGN